MGYPFYLSWNETLTSENSTFLAGVTVGKGFGVFNDNRTREIIANLQADPMVSDIILKPSP